MEDILAFRMDKTIRNYIKEKATYCLGSKVPDPGKLWFIDNLKSDLDKSKIDVDKLEVKAQITWKNMY